MQSASAAFAAAAAGDVYTAPVQRTRVDWARDGTFGGGDDDLTPVVESVSVQRSLATDLPDAAKTFTGTAAATGTVVLGGGQGGSLSASRYLSAYDSGSPLYGTRRVGAPVQVDLGYVTSAGGEYLRVLTGSVLDVDTDSGGRGGSLSLVDLWDRIARTKVTLTGVVSTEGSYGTRRPGLTAQWPLDAVLRQCGFYASPPQRNSCIFSATLHGSLWPELGFMLSMTNAAGPPLFTAGRFATALAGTTANVQATYSTSGTASTVNGSQLLFEGWLYIGAATNTTGTAPWLLSSSGSAAAVSVNVVAGQVQLSGARADAGTNTFTVLGPTVTGAAAWHYVAVSVSMTSTTVAVTFRLDGATSTASVGSATQATAAPLDRFRVATLGVAHEAVQVTTETAPAFNDAFVATAVLDNPYGRLTAIPVVQRAGADAVLTDIAAAEQGMVFVDESGIARFWNRDRLTGGASVATVSAAKNLTALRARETRSAVFNRVRVPASPLRLQPAGWIWALNSDEDTLVPAGGSTTLYAQLDGAPWTISHAWRYQPAGGTGQSAYRGNRAADGTGATVSNLTVTDTTVGDVTTITVTNPNAYDVWLVNPAGVPSTQGTPALGLWGQITQPVGAGPDATASTAAAFTAEASDAASIAAYGEQLLEVPDNPWRQSNASAAALAAALLAQLKDPHPVLDGVEVVADPRLQCGDRITVADPDGLGLYADFRVGGIGLSLSSSGLTQTLDLRGV